MLRIAGVHLPQEKRIEVGLTYLFGIGPSLSKKILAETKINPDTRVKELGTSETEKLKEYIEKNYQIEGDLRAKISSDIKRLKEIGTYRGSRHSKNLPVRGQRTRTNARTKRGKKVTVGSGRKKAAEKT